MLLSLGPKNLPKQNRSPETFAQLIDSRMKTSELENPI